MSNEKKLSQNVILPWGDDNAYINMTDEAKELLSQYLQWCDECSKVRDFSCSEADAKQCNEKKRELLSRILDITDTRTVCVVVGGRSERIPITRHIFRVSEDAENRLEELKAEYYDDYAQLPDDEFHFFRGLHRAQAYGASLRSV